ncbi:rRNA methyltransferase [Dorcoceras hygrometricum]|uniref:rRNA methyltransferase n=1 Tax=Dorcoceras hygrometricum TaxID=472368 RepID=A0A2Z7BMR5_9LAMI|nr:rRNA methyltransferase [Dorcoceras hygrometricum]
METSKVESVVRILGDGQDKPAGTSKKMMNRWISDDVIGDVIMFSRKLSAVVKRSAREKRRSTGRSISRELQCNQQLVFGVSDSKTMSFELMDTTAFCLRAKDSADALCDEENQQMLAGFTTEEAEADTVADQGLKRVNRIFGGLNEGIWPKIEELTAQEWISDDVIGDVIMFSRKLSAVVKRSAREKRRRTGRSISRELQCNQQLVFGVSDSKTMSFELMDTTVFCLALRIQQMLFPMKKISRYFSQEKPAGSNSTSRQLMDTTVFCLALRIQQMLFAMRKTSRYNSQE